MVLRIEYSHIFARIPFDQRTIPGLPWTRMPGSATVLLSPIGCRRLGTGLAMAAALTFVVCAFPATGMLPVQKHEAHHEIDQLEDEWRNAILTSNTKELDSLLADDYMAITPSGTLQTKDEALESLRNGRIHFSALDITDRKVRFYGTTAVVTSLANIQATTADGQVSGSYRYTRVYARDPQGNWKIVSFEASRVREPGPHKRNEFH
jgi:ketosteroid isomerase-like protein